MGRLDPEKGLGVLAAAAHLVGARAPQVRFVVAGGGRREQALRERLGERGRLLGYVRGEALVRLYRAADVVVVPSVYEPFGLVALEAMLCGAAVVVAASGGLAEIVRHGRDGLVVPSGDGPALADAVLALAADPARRRALGEAGQRRAREDFSWEEIARRTRSAYASILGARPAVLSAAPVLPALPAVSAVVVTRDAPAHAETAVRSLLSPSLGLREVVLLDHGSSGPAARRLAAFAGTLATEGHPVRLVPAERSTPDDGALLLAVESCRGERVLVLGDEVEALPEQGGLREGLLWLLDDVSAATVSPTLVSRSQAALPAAPDLAEQYRAGALPRAAFLARRAELLTALGAEPGELGARLRAASLGAHWVHPARMAHGAGEARRGEAPFAAAADSTLPASIVLLAYKNLALTRECLESVLAHTAPPFELVLVDNGSLGETRAFFRQLRARLGPARPVQVIENERNLGFPAGANQGLRAARGRRVVLLNNDTRVCPGWLEALLAAAASEPRVGVVTAKVLNLDLSVQSAGGILHAPDGSFLIPGQGEARSAPAVSQRRRVPNAGGPCMLLTRELLEGLAPGGEVFDEAYSPGYFEDSDLCLRAREAGFTLLYEPGAEVLHHGKATAALVAEEGSLDVWGRFELNRHRFLARWGPWLTRDAEDAMRPTTARGVRA